jgi:hypothetical protein
MNKSLIATEVVRTQLDLDKLRIKEQVYSEYLGIKHNLEIDALASGGWLVDVWIA